MLSSVDVLVYEFRLWIIYKRKVKFRVFHEQNRTPEREMRANAAHSSDVTEKQVYIMSLHDRQMINSLWNFISSIKKRRIWKEAVVEHLERSYYP
jgi:hypothetical protein